MKDLLMWKWYNINPFPHSRNHFPMSKSFVFIVTWQFTYIFLPHQFINGAIREWIFTLLFTILKEQISSVGSEPKLGSVLARAFEKKARLGLARHAFQKARLGLARHILQKKLGSARLALSFKKPSYLEKQKMSWFPTFLPIFQVYFWRHQ